MGPCKSKDNSCFDRAKVANLKSVSVCCDECMPKSRSHCFDWLSKEGSDVLGISGEDGGNKLVGVVPLEFFCSLCVTSHANAE